MKIIISNTKKFLIKDTLKDFHCKQGLIKAKDLKKTKGKIKTNKGEEFFILKPEFIDLYQKIKRNAQIITLKDIGAIITETGINQNSKILDAGAGSGALSCYLAHIVKSVIAYEIREDFAKTVKTNIQFLDLKNIKLKIKDIYTGIDEKNLNLITLDLPEPWKAIKHAIKALKQGGFLVAYTPQITQALEFTNKAVKTEKFVHIKTKETSEREWALKGKIAKPITPLISHTGFLTFLRRI
ncbi:methyltransferase domain-containing protein [Candidatus Woesearchaeota archaeon]|nr:methyltransferase domain-containing protein [Candidatus Woesearchaeota archaeon]MBL7051368.1 methyltransferase domain-containing protein [Candidatus Woesearchaeota archaeon]